MYQKFLTLILLLGFLVFLPFGGRVINYIICANGIWFGVGPPKPGVFMFVPGFSQLFRMFLLLPGVNVVGKATPGGVCLCPHGNCLRGPIGAQGTVRLIGTSAR